MLILQLSLTLVIRISHSKKIMTCDLSLCAELTVISGGEKHYASNGWMDKESGNTVAFTENWIAP